MKLKTKSGLVIGIFTILMIFGVFTLIIGPVNANSPTFIVSPSGGDDTANIQAAFDDAIAAGPGSTVQLTSGQFYTNAIFVEGFCGTFKGTSKSLTKIDVLKGLDDTLEGVVGPEGPYLFTFAGGDVYISDLIFDITPYMPAEPWEDPEYPSYDLVSIILLTGETNSWIENVKYIGHEGTLVNPLGVGFNVRVGVEYHFGTGNHIITMCDFDSIWGAISAYGLMNVQMKISSNSIKGGNFGVINMDNINSKFEIKYNDIETMFIYGIWVWQAGIIVPPSLSQWKITHNTIRVSSSADGIGLMDYSSIKSLEVVVSHNKIVLDDTEWGGIWIEGLQDAFISNNIIRGTGAYGIGSAFPYNNMILGNNVQDVVASWAPIFLYGASECVVVGGSTKTNVADIDGYNNIIVGCNNMQINSLGPEIKEAMELKREIIQSFPEF
ncbi:MAG: right-handed parallel beta-helix repeat-containing protein [Promethearchaeota archaeon]